MIGRYESDDFVDISRSLRIKSRIAPHTSYSSGFRIHDDGRCTIGTGRPHTFSEDIYECGLDIWIDREIEIDSFHFLLSILVKYRTVEAISPLFFFACFAGEEIMEISLYTETTDTISIDKSCDLGRDRTLRIMTNRVIPEYETPRNSIFFDISRTLAERLRLDEN